MNFDFTFCNCLKSERGKFAVHRRVTIYIHTCTRVAILPFTICSDFSSCFFLKFFFMDFFNKKITEGGGRKFLKLISQELLRWTPTKLMCSVCFCSLVLAIEAIWFNVSVFYFCRRTRRPTCLGCCSSWLCRCARALQLPTLATPVVHPYVCVQDRLCITSTVSACPKKPLSWLAWPLGGVCEAYLNTKALLGFKFAAHSYIKADRAPEQIIIVGCLGDFWSDTTTQAV